MDIQLKIEEKQGCFFIEQDGKQVAELDFDIDNNILNAYHTGVRPELEGQGVAGRLFDELVKYARANGYKVKPSCPYISGKFHRSPDEFSDIWHKPNDEPAGEACGLRPRKA